MLLGIQISPASHLQPYQETRYMKKIFLIMALSLSLFAIQSCNNDTNTKEDEKTLSSTDVPAPVQTAFSAKYSTATEVKWEDAHENNVQTYKAKFLMNGKKMKAEFDSNGSLVKEDEDK
jgi:hypothetical protein